MAEEPTLFRIGPGYADYWCHVATHWTSKRDLSIAIHQLHEGLNRLISKRDGVEEIRRRLIPVGTLAQGGPPAPSLQQELFDATHDFFQTYYSTLSTFPRFLNRFRDIVGDVPHASNQRFLEWLSKWALWPATVIPLLESARLFRTALAHPASFPTFDWATVDDNGDFRAFLHGLPRRNGGIPEGATPRLEGQWPDVPAEHSWTFVAPDEDLVAWALAVQLNAIFPIISGRRADPEAEGACTWELKLRDADPRDGYPIFATTPRPLAPGAR